MLIVRKSTQLSNKSQKSAKNNFDFDSLETFSVVPSVVELPPKTGFTFKFKAYSVRTGKLSENFVLSTQLGNQRKT